MNPLVRAQLERHLGGAVNAPYHWAGSQPLAPKSPSSSLPGAGPAGGSPAQSLRRPNPFMGSSVRLPGGATPSTTRNPFFEANDVPLGTDERPAPPGAPQPRPVPPMRDAAQEAADAARQREEFSNRRKAENVAAAAKRMAIVGNDPRAPGGPLHPTQFASTSMPPLRHQLSAIAAHHSALASLTKPGASLSDVLRFASGEHLEPVYRRMAREESMNLMEGRGARLHADAPPVKPRPQGRARVSLHFA